MNIHVAFAQSPCNKVWAGDNHKHPTCIVERVYVPTEVLEENAFHYIVTFFVGLPTPTPYVSFAYLEDAIQQRAAFPGAFLQGVTSGIDWQPLC